MSKRSWIRNVFAPSARRPFRKAPPRTRPAVEALEDRLAPSIITVTRLADDDSAGSLRWAITQANTITGDDTISFSVTGTINLTRELPFLDSNIDISGPGAGSLTVRRNIGDYRIFQITRDRTVTLSGLTIANGRAPAGHGGGIYNEGMLTVNNSTLSGNSSVSGSGGGVYNANHGLRIINSTLSDNSAPNGQGGGIASAGIFSSVTVISSTLSGNRAGGIAGGGGIFSDDGEVRVINSTLSGNSATSPQFSRGGGISVFRGFATEVINSTISGNSATGGPGGGGGGGIYNAGAGLNVYDSTLSGNSANSGYGGGIRYEYTGSAALNNSLVVNSPSGGDVRGIVSGSNNLFGSVALGPLQFNGGPTQTHSLPAGSPAVNAGNNALVPQNVTTDQRGSGFPRIVGGTVDIGAFESQYRTVTWSGASPANGNWTTGANWQGGVAPVPGDDLVFPAGAARPSNSNTFTAGTLFRSLTFSGAGYTLSGNQLTFTTGLTASAAGTNTVAVNLTLGSTQNLTAGAGAQLTLSGVVSGGALSKGGAGQLSVAAPLAAASFTMNDGTVLIPATGYVYCPGNYVQTAGRTTLNRGGIWAALTDLQGGILDGSGWVHGHLRNAARIDVGGAGAAGYLYVLGGNYTQTAAGTLNVELAGPAIGTQYDWLYVEGTASLAGTLNVSRLSGYLPNLGDYFFPLYSGGLTGGTFATITGLTLSPMRALWPYYFANGLQLYTYAT